MTRAASKDNPTDAATLERTKRIANEAMFAVVLQRRRLTTKEPEDKEFVFRQWTDWKFFVGSLWRLRRAVKIASNVPSVKERVDKAIAEFDRAVPNLNVMRNIDEHIDEYSVDSPRRHEKGINRRQLEVGVWDDSHLQWLDYKLNADKAKEAAERLFSQLLQTVRDYVAEHPRKRPS